MHTYKVIGVMSGTSLDGMDLAYCELRKTPKKWTYSVPFAETIHYPEEMKKKLSGCQYGSALNLLEIHNEFAEFTSAAVLSFLKKYNVKADLISSHGHTIFHQPHRGITCQIGNGAIIACKTGITTVADFRIQDVANGGQGAPLVPIGDELFFNDYAACLNLGGFSNISFRKDEKRVAFDICPVNIVLNYLSALLGKEMDEDGKTASTGSIINDLYYKLEKLDYYSRPYPKSLGKEWTDKNIIPLFNSNDHDVKDILRTFTEHIASRISSVIKEIGKGKILVTGGGAFNKYLMKRIAEMSNAIIELPDPIIINYKEALIFALLGILRIRNEVNCMREVTGSRSDISAGIIYNALK